MALLACLWELAPRLGLSLETAVVDHGLRPEAAAEAELVADRAAALGIICHRLFVDVKGARAKPQSGGVQEVARALRLSSLSKLADARGLGVVALGHNADDQSETILFRILRGTDVEGVMGIPYCRPPFVRPLLDVTRAQILNYLHKRSIPFASDPSNLDLRYARARIRHEVLPALRRENPRVDEALRRLATSAAGRGLSVPGDRDVHVPGRVGELVASAIRDGRGTRVFDLPEGRRISVTYGRAEIIKGTETHSVNSPPNENQPHSNPVALPGPGRFPWSATAVLDVSEQSVAPERLVDPYDQWFDAESLSWPLAARIRRPGDRMRPRKGQGTRKLADLMIDAKMPRHHRSSVPVIVDSGGGLLFVPGLRAAETGKPTPQTKRWIRFNLRASGDDVG